MKTIRQFGAFFWIGLSAVVCVDSFRSGIGAFRSPGSGFFPFWLGVILAILALTLGVVNLLKPEGEKGMDLWKGTRWRAVTGVMILTLIYSLLLKPLGYLIATFVLMTVLFCMAERKRIGFRIGIGFVVVLASYVTFQYWLKVSLPKGVLSF
jgi:putative tricarboxylic transport membrane protein